MSGDVRTRVRERYADAAKGKGGCCESSGCCCSTTAEVQSRELGYSAADISALPDGANLGLGCGNPTALAALETGQVVVDLGSGGGIDCFLAAKKVGPSGRVIGVDMTPEMIDRARGAAEREGYRNVEFRLGEIEHLPVPDGVADVVISNCVVNLSPDKAQVFREAHRVLRPGGRLLVSDIVVSQSLPEEIRRDMALYSGCLAGAMVREEYLEIIRAAGFTDVEVLSETGAEGIVGPDDPTVSAIAGRIGFSSEQTAQVLSSALSVSVSALA